MILDTVQLHQKPILELIACIAGAACSSGPRMRHWPIEQCSSSPNSPSTSVSRSVQSAGSS